MMENGQTLTVRPQRSQGRSWRDFVLAAVGMLIFQTALVFSKAVSWDYSIVVDSTPALLPAVGALLCVLWMNVLLWRLNSLTGDHDVGRYWIYCTIMSALCWFSQNLDGSGGIPMQIALVSTPFASVGTLTALVLDGARYRVCCAVCFVFCLAEVLYHQRLLCRHMAEHVGKSGDGMNTAEEPVVANL